MAEEAFLVITAATHPALHSAFEKISHDAGFGAGHETYSVPEDYVALARIADTALATLTPEELETFSIGDQDEMEVISQRSPELRATNGLLHSFFCDWDADPWSPPTRNSDG